MQKTIACFLPDVEDFREVAAFLLKRCDVLRAEYSAKCFVAHGASSINSINIFAYTLNESDKCRMKAGPFPEKPKDGHSVFVYASDCSEVANVIEDIAKEFNGYLVNEFKDGKWEKYGEENDVAHISAGKETRTERQKKKRRQLLFWPEILKS